MKVSQLAQLVFIVLAAIGVYSFVSSARDGERRRVCTPLCAMGPNYADLNRTAPDFELPKLGGGTVKLSDYRGKVVILNFWTKSCRPCLEEMPSLAELAALLEKKPGVELLTICTDETAEDAEATLRSILGTVPPFVTAIDADSEIVADKYGTKLYPETWFIDGQGVIRARFDGARDWATPLTLEFADSLKDPMPCAVQFIGGKPKGQSATICEDFLPG